MIGFGFRPFRLGEVFGIPVFLDWSTIFIALMFLQSGSIAFALGLTGLLLASIVLHELGHSLTARCFGCDTRCITLTVIGGCASLERMPRKAWQEFLTAAAGPLVSFALGVVLYVASAFLPERSFLPQRSTFQSLRITRRSRPSKKGTTYITASTGNPGSRTRTSPWRISATSRSCTTTMTAISRWAR